MATVFKKTFTKPLPANAEITTRRGERIARWKDGKGKLRTAPVTSGKDGVERVVMTADTFTAKYRDGAGIVCEVATGCRDEVAARAVLNQLNRRAELVKSGVVSTGEDGIADHQAMPIQAHIEDYLNALTAKGDSPGHIVNVRRELTRATADCGIKTLKQMERPRLERWLAEFKRAEGKKGKRKSARTCNGYLATVKSFAAWCCSTARMIANPFEHIPAVAGEMTRKRRAMTEEELGKLLEVARNRPLVHALKIWRGKREGEATARVRPDIQAELERRGWERALVYKTLVLTGLRRGELASITGGQVALDGENPHLVLHAAAAKNRKPALIPLTSELAGEIGDWVKAKLKLAQAEAEKAGNPVPVALPHDTPLFEIPAQLSKIMDKDLTAAGIPKKDASGRTLDVHSLRHTFATMLSMGGVAPRTAQAAL
ncbi:tyrosine-type recombinase/integrase, partial [Candidatus Sumerlaeota bacterium]|nr:tyrosine-type recombinase/integrase [Candidatus Sumerlaeota bacterium]